MSLRRQPTAGWTWIPDLLAVVVILCWAISFITDILMERYDPPPAVHVAFLAVVGSYYGVRLIRTNGNSGR